MTGTTNTQSTPRAEGDFPGNLVPAIGLTEIDGEPRARDLDLADRLGFGRPRDIRKVIERNRVEIEAFGQLRQRGAVVSVGTNAEREVMEWWLSEEQSLLVAILSKAPNAPAVRAMLIKTFVAWRRGRLDTGITAADVERIFDGRLASFVPALIDAASMKVQFGVTRDTMTAGQVCDLAKVPTKGRRGLILRVSNALRRHCARVNIAPREAVLGATSAYVFPTKTAREWLDHEGRDIIKRYLEEKAGQTVVRLVGKAEGQEHRKPL